MAADVIDPILLGMLACPETKQPMAIADAETVARLNALQREGKLKNRAGEPVGAQLESGLIRQDGAYLYPIIDGIPVMLPDEGIPLK